jgi:hypothetical protein
MIHQAIEAWSIKCAKGTTQIMRCFGSGDGHIKTINLEWIYFKMLINGMLQKIFANSKDMDFAHIAEYSGSPVHLSDGELDIIYEMHAFVMLK